MASGSKKPSGASGPPPDDSDRVPIIYVIVPVLIIIVAVAATYLYVMNKGRQQCFSALDGHVDKVIAEVEKGTESWNKHEKGEIDGQTAVMEIHGFHAHIDQLCFDIEEMRYEGLAAAGLREFTTGKNHARDLCLASSNYLFAMASTIHFSFFPGRLTEAKESFELTKHYKKETEDIIEVYRKCDYLPELSGQMKDSEDAQYVFVILVDAKRADHTSPLNYERDTTPAMKLIAGRGVLFGRAFAQCSTTDTSVASLFTGLYPRAHKMIGGSDWLWEHSLVEGIRRAGFTTAAFSANSLISADSHYDHGFDHFRELPWARATIMMSAVIRWFERAATQNDRIFTYIHLIDPHDIYYAPVPFTDYFDKGYPVRTTAYGIRRITDEHFMGYGDTDPSCDYNPMTEHWGDRERFVKCLRHHPDFGELKLRDVENLEARYDGEIRYADFEIQRFVRYLEFRGIIRKSIIVLLSDHGESFLEHNQTKHGRVLYDNEIHVPLVFWGGRDQFGAGRREDLVELVDVFPTLYSALDIDIPAGIHGKDLFAKKNIDAKDTVYSLAWNGWDPAAQRQLELTAARTDRFKYIRAADPDTGAFVRDEFYDIETDPGELTDARRAFPEHFQQLKAKLEWWNDVTDRTAPRPLDRGPDKTKKQKLRDLGYIK